MPMYQFEAMDRTGQEIKDVIEAPSEEEAQNTIKGMGYFVTKLSLKKGTDQAYLYVYPSVVDPPGRRFADPSIATDPREQHQGWQAQECAHGRVRRDRDRIDAL